MSASRILPASTLAAVLLAVAAGPTLAQEEPTQRFRDRIQVTEVLLDVLVTDGDGNVVVGLEADDFIVEDDGKPIDLGSVTFFGSQSLLDSPALAQRLGGAASSLPMDRFFILLFHDLRREGPQLMRRQREAARQAQRWADSELGERDWVAVTSYFAKLRVYQDFTRDKEKIRDALDEVARGKDPDDTWPASVQLGDEPSLMRHLAQGKELRKQTTRIQDALRVLADAAAPTRGRKNLLFFSLGFGDVDRFGWTPDPRYYPRMERALNDANVAVYPVSLLGSALDRQPVADLLGQSLSQLANDTGGYYYRTFANFATPLGRVVEENGGYYLLGYSAEVAAGDSGYRQVKVRTKNPDLKVRARDGYLFGS